jgi:hypothetical protein
LEYGSKFSSSSAAFFRVVFFSFFASSCITFPDEESGLFIDNEEFVDDEEKMDVDDIDDIDGGEEKLDVIILLKESFKYLSVAIASSAAYKIKNKLKKNDKNIIKKTTKVLDVVILNSLGFLPLLPSLN